ncbi:putative Memo like protein [Trypanosoma vivax]|uniref:Protein MEMO1 n=1 Tax=Trypanosoma vivax (strain Y486) TaxID=1055687 RepID=G0U6K2_TRYVY|nr:hypothetical protein TRVL_03178 [Trypanosoma vivax]KAH8611906.1 putative Memo like protein [Trypanosoma vivax]CCC51506.1 conserved hypothetical protein [Trypanosoma vivax Y486]
MSYSRCASHAGSWYEGSSATLKSTVGALLAVVQDHKLGDERLVGVISPHAGIRYSGGTAGHVFAAVRDYVYGPRGGALTRMFLIGPSHYKSFSGVEVCGAKEYETPFGPLSVSAQVLKQLAEEFRSAGVPVGTMTRATDEEEHSIELQLPFISHILHFPCFGGSPAKDRVQLVPLLIGGTDAAMDKAIGNVLAKYTRDPANLFVISSDFCHWGSRFQYTYHFERSKYPAIGDAIVAMDHAGMQLLEQRNLQAWYKYLEETNNTICGRRPITVAMAALHHHSSAAVRFVHYSQSNRCQSLSDSSVSYAGAIIMEP